MSVLSRIRNLWSGEEQTQPSPPPSPAQTEKTVLAGPPLPKLHKILVVDDNPVILKTLSFKLQSKGYQVFTAVDGAEGVTAARKEKPDLILLDISFPPDVSFGGGVAWDGFRIMDWLRRSSEDNKIPIIVITGGDPAKYESQARKAGAVGFFQKPINHDELLKVIRQILEEKPVSSADAPAPTTEI